MQRWSGCTRAVDDGTGGAEVRARAGAAVRRARTRLPARRLCRRPRARRRTPFTVRREEVLSKCGWSPFEGATFRSRIAATWVNGALAWDGEKLRRRCTRPADAVRAMNKAGWSLRCCWPPAQAPPRARRRTRCDAVPGAAVMLPTSASQGALVIGTTHAAAARHARGRQLRVSPDGTFVFGIGRMTRRGGRVRSAQPGTDGGACTRRHHAPRLADRTHRRRAAGDRESTAGNRRAHRTRAGTGRRCARPRR